MNRNTVTVVGSYAIGLTMRTPRMPVAGETLMASEFDQGPGGKGSNQAIQAARMGATTRLVAIIGRDGFGDDALALWKREGIDVSLVERDADLATGAGFILLDDRGENRILLHQGANALLTGERLPADIGTGAVVLTQLETPISAAVTAMRLGRRAGATTILNTAPAAPLPEGLLPDVDVLVFNETEARILLGRPPDQTVEESQLCRDLLARGAGAVVMTLGARGALVGRSEGFVHVEAPTVEVVDTTGAGDAFTGTLAAALAGGADLDSGVRRAVQAGALACTQLGVVPSLPARERISGAVPEVVA